jgi:hypothetical protein
MYIVLILNAFVHGIWQAALTKVVGVFEIHQPEHLADTVYHRGQQEGEPLLYKFMSENVLLSWKNLTEGRL